MRDPFPRFPKLVLMVLALCASGILTSPPSDVEIGATNADVVLPRGDSGRLAGPGPQAPSDFLIGRAVDGSSAALRKGQAGAATIRLRGRTRSVDDAAARGGATRIKDLAARSFTLVRSVERSGRSDCSPCIPPPLA